MELNRVRNMIRAHEKEGKEKVERYLQELREERERLEDMKAENSHFLLQNNVVEILQNRKGRVEQLEDATFSDESESSVPGVKMAKEALASFTELDIHVVPQHLEFISSHDTGGECYAAHFNKDGQLLIGSEHGIQIYTSDLNHESTLAASYVTSITSSGGEHGYYFIEHSEHGRIVEKVSPDFSDRQEVFRYNYPGRREVLLAVTAEFVVGTAKMSLLVYNSSTKSTARKIMGFQPNALRFDSDNNLLITTSDELKKYRFDGEGKLTLMWTCAGLEGAGGIALTRYGDIVVKSGREKQIHIISPQGELLQTITHDALTKESTFIDIHGDILIEPYWGENKFNRFLIS